MAHALNRNMTLQVLNLNHNQISDKGVTALAHALNGNTTLQQLGLGNNEIGDEGVMTLASLLNGNTTLRIFACGQWIKPSGKPNNWKKVRSIVGYGNKDWQPAALPKVN